ncbi:MAG: hypothetical protein A2Y12_16560 [Planctomycetes bacterium GWF2_42_9]|nr:MAG: hypothetical protein A2Y12_16560 [Planctomycetes bacterium GWF2_42_9]
MRIMIAAAIFCIFMTGCASKAPQADVAGLQTLIEARTGKHVQWNQGAVLDHNAAQAVNKLLEHEMSVDEAVQVALLNNPSIQSFFEELGIAQADVVQAGLFRNPVFSAKARFPDGPPSSTNTEFSVTQDFLDVFLRPVRQKLAIAQYEQAKLQVANRVLDLSNQVQQVYYRLQGQMQIVRMRQMQVEVSQAAAEMAGRQYIAGNINDLDLANEQAAFHQSRLELAQDQIQIEQLRAELTSLMGLWGQQINWKIMPDLAQLPSQELSTEDIEKIAVANRLDLAAAKQQMQIVSDALNLAHKGIISEVQLGIDTERDTDGTNVTGPSIELPLPIFDRRQAQIQKLEAQMKQSRHIVDSLAIGIRSEVRATAGNLAAKRQIVQYYFRHVIPLRAQIVALTLEQYNAMITGVYDLLTAKQMEFAAKKNYLEALRDYWILRSQLERTLGGARLVTNGAIK